jgi:hypothetical protein
VARKSPQLLVQHHRLGEAPVKVFAFAIVLAFVGAPSFVHSAKGGSLYAPHRAARRAIERCTGSRGVRRPVRLSGRTTAGRKSSLPQPVASNKSASSSNVSQPHATAAARHSSRTFVALRKKNNEDRRRMDFSCSSRRDTAARVGGRRWSSPSAVPPHSARTARKSPQLSSASTDRLQPSFRSRVGV